MTEAEWLSCANLMQMLDFLRGRASDRKWRLYLCGGCRQIAHLFFSPDSAAAVDVAERFSDDLADEEELRTAEWGAEAATFGFDFEDYFWKTYPAHKMQVVSRLVEMGALPEAVLHCNEWQANKTVKHQLCFAARLAEASASPCPHLDSSSVRSFAQIDWPGRWLLDCIFGNPFRSVTFNPAWRTHTVYQLAAKIYETRAFDLMPILGDALEEAGCTLDAVVEHCRNKTSHVRGCWVVDLLLGKE